MANLYELEKAIADFELEIDEDTGEILNLEELDQLQLERDTKIENIALWIKNLTSDAEAYKKEKESFYQKERAAKNKAENLKRYLQDFHAGEKYKSDRVTISYRKSQSVTITDPGQLPAAFLRHKDPEPDKAKIKELLREGVLVAGAELTDKVSMQIK